MAKTNTTRIPSGAICVGFRANSRFDFKLKTHSTVGFRQHIAEIIFSVEGIKEVRLLQRTNWMPGKIGKL